MSSLKTALQPSTRKPIKTLMFGWEFPPHISGGLGTACLGLTKAMSARGLEITFVAPRLYGDEAANGVSLASASDVRASEDADAVAPYSDALSSSAPTDTMNIKKSVTDTQSAVTQVLIPSPLIPYTDPTFRTESQIRHWNYTFHDDGKTDNALRNFPPGNSLTDSFRDTKASEPYQFQGGYGPGLMDEVARYAQAAVEVARSKQFDVIHCHDWMTFPAGVAVAKKTGKPLVVHVHATEIDRSAGANREIFDIEKYGMHQANHVITVSDWTRQIVRQHYEVPAEKINVVHNGVDAIEEHAVDELPKFNGRVVTFLGRITYQKGPAYFIEAARHVLNEFPDTHFMIAGGGDMMPETIERVASLRLSKRIHFTGFVSGQNLDRLWAMTDVYVMPSVSEPFGITPLEAIQRGIPVVMSRQSGVAEVMPHALIADFWDTRAFAAAICNLLRHPSLYETIAEKAGTRLKQITWSKAAAAVSAVYENLMSKEL